MNLLGTSTAIAFDRKDPAEYRIGSYLVQMSRQMTEPFDERHHVGVTEFFFGPLPSYGPLPFRSDALDIEAWRPALLRAMWASASEALRTRQASARWYAEKLAVDETPLREAGVEVFTIDLVPDPRDILVSRRAFTAGQWATDAVVVADELATRLNELDTRPADLRIRYEDLARDLDGTARKLAERLEIELSPSDVGRPEAHATSASASASIGRWTNELSESDAATMTPLVALPISTTV